MTAIYYANPYRLDASGFYFHDFDEYQQKADKLNAQGVEELELDYIDGEDAELFKACGVHQGNLHVWFEEVEELEDYEKVSLYYLTAILGYTMEDALQEKDDYPVSEGTAQDYAEELIDDTGALNNLPENLRYYFDYAAFARDLVLGGDVYEFEYAGQTYTANR